MAINKRPPKVSELEIAKVIDAGGSQPNEVKTAVNTIIDEDVRITISIPGDLTKVIDRVRMPTKTSRRTWLLQAAYEKLKRDGEL